MQNKRRVFLYVSRLVGLVRRLFRQAGGKFRGPTLADYGHGVCNKCGCLFEYMTALNKLREKTPMLDPRDVKRIQTTCPKCEGGEAKDTGMIADTPPPTGEAR